MKAVARTIVVTGGLGFIGSHIVEAIIAAGDRPVIIDDRSSSVRGFAPRVPTYTLTIGVDKISEPIGHADAVIHCAAYADIRHNWDSADERAKILEKNVRATVSVLETTPPRTPLVFLSSASVYGPGPDRNLTDAPFEPDDHEWSASPEWCQSPYAASKLAAEAFVRAYSCERRWYALRLVNTYGARLHRGVIPDFVRMARKGRIHALDRGEHPKSAVHVRDVAGAALRCLADDGPPPGAYDVTSSELWGWRDLVRDMGWTGPVTWENRNAGTPGDPVGLQAMGERLRPWYECRTPVRDGVRDALRGFGWGVPAIGTEAAQ